MGYRIRILTPSEATPSFAKLKAVANELGGTLEDEPETDRDWSQIALLHQDGPDIANIERHCADTSDLVASEIQWFLDDITGFAPASAVEWLSSYLPTVRTIYAFQLLSGTETRNGWELLDAVKHTVWQEVGGIIQADLEGFSDTDGYHILWQFSDTVSGPCWMGVLKDGNWVHFQMDLGNVEHRQAFLRGDIPEGVEIGEFS